MEEHLTYLKNCMSQHEINLTDLQLEQFHIYFNLLVETNKVMNLTAITEAHEVMIKHFLDSSLLAEYVELPNGAKVLDIGTGAGFPGLPLKIVRPDLKVTLADSLNKRIKFLQNVIDELSLDGIEAIHTRAEDAARNAKMRDQYDYVVSRAVANLSTLSEYCLPFVKEGGYFIPYKSSDCKEEINNASHAFVELKGKLEDVITFDLPEEEGGRSLIIIKKTGKTPKKYPRKAGVPSKEPL